MSTIVSLISYPFLPAKVGGQKGVGLFNKYFSHYYKIVCVTTKKNDPTAAEGYEVLNILSNSPLRYINVFYFFTLSKIIRQRKATHLILEHPYYGWLAILLKLFCRIKLVVHSHNMEGLRWKTLHKWWWPIMWQYEKWTHRCADYNFFIHDEDRQYAIRHFGLNESKCITMTYGIEWDHPPSARERQIAKQELLNQYNIPSGHCILLFNGAFNYSPNIDALKNITDFINALLLERKDLPYSIIICGRDIPAEISEKKYPNIIFAGFVDNISLYFKGTDVFLNPIREGGGIKTKLVEALGYNMNVVSTETGAIGVDQALCNGKLLLCGDNDWYSFAGLVVQAATISSEIPVTYFNQFFWENIVKKGAAFISLPS